MDEASDLWAVVLAAGDGTRLRDLTTSRDGFVVPKQFCSFGPGRSLFAATLERAWSLVPAERVVAVVAQGHGRLWADEVSPLAPWNVVVQPRNRGTAAGLLLPLLHVAERDRNAVVLVLPSDHQLGDEEPFGRSLRLATRAARRQPDCVVLVGVTPEEPEPDYGWIVPGPSAGDGMRRVEAFVEKPDRAEASRLLGKGGVWSTFVMAGRVQAFLDAFAHAAPELLEAFRQAGPAAVARGSTVTPELKDLYARLPVADFSRSVLEVSRDRLRVVTCPPCGWTDLGTPARVTRWLNRRGLTVSAVHPTRTLPGPLAGAAGLA